MKTKAQSLGLAIIVSIFILIIGFTILNFVKDEVTRARTDLSCADAADISDGTKLLCLAIDGVVPSWIVIIFSIIIGAITVRMKTGGITARRI